MLWLHLALGGTLLLAARAQLEALQVVSDIVEEEQGLRNALRGVQKVRHDEATLRSSNTTQPYWPMKNGGSSRCGWSPEVAPSQISGGPTWNFTEPNDGLIRAGPIIGPDSDIYLCSVVGNVYRFSKTGTLKWNVSLGQQIPQSPGLLGDTLCVVTSDGFAWSLNISDGHTVWKQKIGDAVGGDTASILVGEGTVVIAVQKPTDPLAFFGGNNLLVALDASTGSTKWTYRPQIMVYNALMSFVNDTLVFADEIGHVLALRLSDGQRLWSMSTFHLLEIPQMTTGGAVLSRDGERVYVNSDFQYDRTTQGRITALNVRNGRKLWSRDFVNESYVAPGVGPIQIGSKMTEAVILALGPNPDLPVLHPRVDPKPGLLLALDAETGETLWSFELPTWNGPAAGDTLAHVCLPDAYCTPTIGGDGTTYIGFQNGVLYALKDSNGDGALTGSEVSSFNLGNAFQGSSGIGPGMLVSTPCNSMHVWLSP